MQRQTNQQNEHQVQQLKQSMKNNDNKLKHKKLKHVQTHSNQTQEQNTLLQ